jgi:hypothetical protein
MTLSLPCPCSPKGDRCVNEILQFRFHLRNLVPLPRDILFTKLFDFRVRSRRFLAHQDGSAVMRNL